MKATSAFLRVLAMSAAALAFASCSAGGGTPSLPAQSASGILRTMHHQTSKNPIKHIVIIVQENRSFNNLFYDFHGATTVKYGYDSSGDKVTLQPVGLETTWDFVHDYYDFLQACNGTGSVPGTDCQMNGFNNETWQCGSNCPDPLPPYSYVPHYETKPYFFMGKHYVLADQMYASNLDASSFISHQYIIAGQASSAVNYPYNRWGCEGSSYDKIYTLAQTRQYGSEIPMCWNNNTIGSEMDSAGLSWAYYASTVNGDGGIWSAYQNIEPIYDGPDWTNDVISPQTNFFNDVSNGKLRDVSWITPTCANSDHAGCGSNTGPAWVASLVNAVGESQYWNSTAIFIFWDDYGGWYDPEPPAMLDYDGLGLRIPMLIVSAYAKKGKVDHTHYEHGSILKFVEDTFGLSTLSASDKRATAPYAAFNFNKPPRKFEVVPAEHGIDFFKHQAPDHRNPDPG